jgi:hypothetical protein
MIEEQLKQRYPAYCEQKIRKITTIFSFSPHASDKYVVKPKINILHISIGYAAYEALTLPYPFSPLFLLFSLTLGAYGLYVTSTCYEHELSHAYRRRYIKFMEKVKGKKQNKFFSFIDCLEENALSSNKFRSFLSRELALILSIPISFGGYVAKRLVKDKSWYWEEELAKYEAEKLSGKRANPTPKKIRKFFEILEELRMDNYVPLKECEEKKEINEELKFYLENPPAILPKYKIIDKLYQTFLSEQ